MMDSIPPKVQNQIAQFQQLTQQIQMVATQKIQIEAQVRAVKDQIQQIAELAPGLPREITIFAIEVEDVTSFSEECTPRVKKAVAICRPGTLQSKTASTLIPLPAYPPTWLERDWRSCLSQSGQQLLRQQEWHCRSEADLLQLSQWIVQIEPGS